MDAPRLRRMRLHLVAVCELNRETWLHIRKETDDDLEWLPHPKQTDQLGLTLSDTDIKAWLAMMERFEGLLNGERLLPSGPLRLIHNGHDLGQGLNMRRVLDDPPADLLNFARLQAKGIDAKFLEPEEGKQLFDLSTVFVVFRLFNGPLGVANAARLN